MCYIITTKAEEISDFLISHSEIGQSAVNSLRKFGVDTSKIVRGGERVGIYYCEKGASQRPSKVIYDRAYSSIAMSKKEVETLAGGDASGRVQR